MKNFIQPGNVIEIFSAAAVAAGDGVLFNELFGVAANTTTAAGTVPCAVTGVYSLPKASAGQIDQGSRLFWDNSNDRVTETAGGNVCIGVAAATALDGDTTCEVLLRGSTPAGT